MAFDFLSGNKYKKLYEDELRTSAELKQELDELKNIKLSVAQMEVLEVENAIKEKQRELEQLDLFIIKKQEHLKSVEVQRNDLQNAMDELKKDIISGKLTIQFQEVGLYEPRYEFVTSTAYKTEFDRIRNQQKEMIKNGDAVELVDSLTFENSLSKGKQLLKKQAKLMLRAFNGECEAAINKVTYSNLSAIEKRIKNSLESINKLSGFGLCEIKTAFLDLKIQELYLAYEYEQKKEEERELLREQREKEKEEKALQKEIADKKKIIDKEITHLKNAMDELSKKISIATEMEKATIFEKIEKIKQQITEHEVEKEELDYRLVQASAGYVYIISNIGSFGENVVKIGVTRRLDPLERISELSSASVPFKFDIHALIFSNEAYQLESYLHKKFEKYRVNMINHRKEFFRINIHEIREVLDNEFKELTFEWEEIPAAEEYRQTLKLCRTE